MAWIVLGIAVVWVLLIWRVKVECGRVHLTEVEKFRRNMVKLQITFGDALTPALKRAAEQMRAFAEAYRESLEQDS